MNSENADANCEMAVPHQTNDKNMAIIEEKDDRAALAVSDRTENPAVLNKIKGLSRNKKAIVGLATVTLLTSAVFLVKRNIVAKDETAVADDDVVDDCSNRIENLWGGRGFMVECNDGSYSMSGGIRGACSHHGGTDRSVCGG